jgi:hypothetical protein
MTLDEFKALTDEEQSAYIEKLLAESNIEGRTDALVVESEVRRSELQRRVDELEFEKVFRDAAIYGQVLPKAVKYLITDARQVFELRDGILSPRDGRTLPGDPLSPLTVDVWLKEIRQKESYLFERPVGNA